MIGQSREFSRQPKSNASGSLGVAAQEAAGGLLSSSLLSLFVLLIAWRKGYFRLPPPSLVLLKFREVINIFLIYLSLAFFLLPIFNLFLIKFVHSIKIDFLWIQLFNFFILFLFLIGYCFLLPKAHRLSIFWGGENETFKRFSKAFLMGIISLIVSYPLVSLMGHLSSLLSYAIWKQTKVDQIAVEQLLRVRENKPLFLAMSFFVVIIVPFIEELLFRGFLQTYLKRYLGRLGGIGLTAVIFSLFHFAPSQGIGNFQLILSLFVLSVFLGFIYEREKTLFASIALHASFNASTVLLILFGMEN